MYTDRAPVNVKMYKLIKEELGYQYILMCTCPAPKIELLIQDALEESLLNNGCDKDYINIYYLFKKANLHWRLFKCQALFKEQSTSDIKGSTKISSSQPSDFHLVLQQPDSAEYNIICQ